MAAQYNVEAIKIENKTVELRLTIINPEEPDFYENPSFGLMVLYDRAQPMRYPDAELGKAIEPEKMLDPAWMVANAPKYISSVKIMSRKNHPADPDLDFTEATVDELPQATMKIVVEDSKWISHIKQGMTWKSAAFDTRGYV
jgi:hypothetical protein